jgi:hypothetical protein
MRKLSIYAQTAKAIRTELKEKFPETKFSVTSETFSMGNAVRIGWTDGPTEKAVKEIVDKYQYGHFDGMIDCYEYSNTRDDIPQVKYVTTQRDMSDEVRDKIVAEHNKEWDEKYQIKDLKGYNDGFQEWNSTVIYREFNKRNFGEVAE